MKGFDDIGKAPLRPSAAVAFDLGVVEVKLEKKAYTIHKKLLTEYSGYFRRKLSKNEGILNLHHFDRKSFEIFIDWIYEKTLPSCIADDGVVSLRYRAYVLAQQLSAIPFKTALMGAIFDKDSQSIPQSPEVKYLFFCLPDEDPMLQFLVDAFCVNNGIANMNVDDFLDIEALPKGYLGRILRKLHQLSDTAEKDKLLRRGDYIMMLCFNHMGITSTAPIVDEAKDSETVEFDPTAEKEARTSWGECNEECDDKDASKNRDKYVAWLGSKKLDDWTFDIWDKNVDSSAASEATVVRAPDGGTPGCWL
ncbi:hypothetical protein P3342_009532 [Pyrenophora teres f. teres]|uniref:BTB domain containing protein n=1 Tax=Pyrenophora teres f. teres TaxID=97479 RepID=A0A6S6W7T7_9PLEO|nr:hypothetical protein HRS9139_08833 [Pyrenophora teres f. teres]CAA9964063.1 BTB domain containing protein [Pyrenophora teres f. maculata]KAE8834820.1 hypothetical protein PTNB85_06153 [Pyrenophora teres f. teres]KAE8859240.1 hypothetical protein PTNB73_08720 [Pyrenophora teres f. teres]KAK1908681.1 hypothetical protein P3342_009532 [Pyrenophora teres f. teres]